MTPNERAVIGLLQDSLYEPLTPVQAQTVRESLGLSQRELSLRLGFAANALSRYESGARIARSGTLLKLAIIGAIVAGEIRDAQAS